MFYIGCHLSSAKGFLAMAKDAERIGATTFQFFTRNPRGGNAKKPDPEDIAAFLKRKEELGLGPLIAHAPYTLNAASDKPEVRDFAFRAMSEDVRRFSKEMFFDDMKRMEYVPGNYYNFHPGSHVGQGSEEGIRLIAGMLNEILTPKLHTTVLLETMAGKGSEIGRSFEELKNILDRVDKKEYIGVCFDTCHTNDSGYDIVNDFDGVINEFDKIIGLDSLKVFHINGSLNCRGAKKDRHANIGADENNPKGRDCIGFDAINYIVHHKKTQGRPFILETPWISKTENLYKQEIAMLRGDVI